MIYFGPAGNIDSDLLGSLEKVSKLNLNSQELEFVYSVNVKEELAKKAQAVAKKNNLFLSVHASYFINLNSLEPQKIVASKKRILDACFIADKLSSLIKTHVVFHPGFYSKMTSDDAYENIKKEILELQNEIFKKDYNCVLAPETTGKSSQFGSIEELVKLSNETGVRICVDFAHVYARNLGKVNWDYVFDKINDLKFLKKNKFLHCHCTGIEYGEKGEKKHINLNSDFFYPIAKKLIEFENRIDFNIISESPITYKDSLLMKKIIDKIKNKKN